MEFSEAVTTLETLIGEEAEASVWGADEEGSSIANLCGVLRQMPQVELDLPSGLRNSLGEQAVIFLFGDNRSNHLSPWPTRFVDASWDEDSKLVELRTLDGRILIGRRFRPWID